jgi:hypothetical protein
MLSQSVGVHGNMQVEAGRPPLPLPGRLADPPWTIPDCPVEDCT